MKLRTKIITIVLAFTMALFLFAGCNNNQNNQNNNNNQQQQQQDNTQKQGGKIILSTTTSTNDSGLLDYLLPEFKNDTGIEVDVVSVGTGKAIQNGIDGEADVLLVHARASEDEFMANGHGILRYDVMYNDFVLVGPASDPANVKAAENNIANSLKAIADTKSTFISRGDDSGTHKKELEIWKAADITPQGDWYVEAGTGMGAVLTMANEKSAYTITDRATYLSMKDNLDLVILCEKDSVMLNPYGVIVVNPDKNDQINEEGAKAFADWLVSEKGQNMIKEFGVDTYGEPLFIPDAKKAA